MVAYDDGSRICNRFREPLAALDTNYLLRHDQKILILAHGVFMDDGDSMLAASSHAFTWQWRRTGGTYANLTPNGEIQLASAGTVLANGTIVSTVNKRTLQSGIAVNALTERTTSAATVVVSTDVADQRSSESQVAVSFAGAIPGVIYEFRVEYSHSAGSNTVDLVARVIVPLNQNTWRNHPRFRG